MRRPKLKEEEKLWEKKFKVVCFDEAGRGALAGPVVAAAVMVNSKLKIKKFKNLNDSKKLTQKKREFFYKIIHKSPFIEWGIGIVSEKIIDKINIFEATKLAMKKAFNNLIKKSIFRNQKIKKLKRKFFLILDGNFKLNLDISQKSIIKADEKIFSCALASILAKVNRDRILLNYHKKYPQYGFDKHKGYPTKLHRKMLEIHGPCKIHRKSFKLLLSKFN